MAANMYRVGDCVYFETSSTSPYQIRRIEELNKTPSGNVEAKVMCFYRRRDLPNPLIQLADKHQMAQSEDSPIAMKLKKICLKTPVGEEQAAQAVLDPALVHHLRDRPEFSMRDGLHHISLYTPSEYVVYEALPMCWYRVDIRAQVVNVARPSLAGYRLEPPPPAPALPANRISSRRHCIPATLKRIRFSRCENDAFLPRALPPRTGQPRSTPRGVTQDRPTLSLHSYHITTASPTPTASSVRQCDRILPAAAVVTAVFRGRADLFGRTPFGGRGVGRATHRATSTHLTGSISKQRMPEQKNHTPDHPKGAHVTDTPPLAGGGLHRLPFSLCLRFN
uniref:BAH domain-containing protein n=1 Tax=Heliothis virescens TaxID=7102 RepID=A0A2A4JN58_HELVI